MLNLKDGNIEVGEINERMPAITNGLVAHFPFDGRGGSFDGIGGHQTSQNIEAGINLIEAMSLDWRDPSSWHASHGMSWDPGKQAMKVVAYHNTWLKTPIVVDINKIYQIEYEVMIEDRGAGNSILYLGGLSNNKDGVRATQNYDYTVAAGVALPLNTWTTFRLTRTGTSAMYSGTSYTFNTIKGWTGDSATLTDKLIKFYHMGGLFNYSAGGTMYIRKLSVIVANNDTSNCTIHDDGIAVEEATTNVATGTITPHTPYNTLVRDGQNLTLTMGSGTQYLTIHTGIYYNKILSISGYLKKNGRPHKLPGNRASTYNSTPATIWYFEEDTGYFKIVENFNGSGVWIFHTPAGTVGGDIITIEDFQIEEKPFATSFVNGSRGTPRLGLPKDILDYQSFTVFMKLQFTQPSGSNNMYFDAFPKLYIFRNGGSHYISWIDTAQRSLSFGVLPNLEEFNIAVTREYISAINVVTKTYYNGILSNSYSSTSAPSMLMNYNIGDSVKLQGWGASSYISNSIVKQLTTYNRALSSDEIKTLATPKTSLSQNTILTELVEEPIFPADGYYFSLGADAIDKYKAISASSEVNTVYENSSVWVGNVTSNLIDCKAYRLYSNNGSIYPIQDEECGGHRRIRRNPDFVTYPSAAFSCYTSMFYNATAGQTYAHSLKVRPEEDVNLSIYGAPYTFCPAGRWTTLTALIDRPSTASVRAPGLTSNSTFNNNFNPWIEYKEFQIEQKPFVTPFTPNTRGDTKLSLSPDIINLDEGTISCWFKPSPGFFTTTSWNRVFGHSTAANRNEIQVKRNSTGNNLVMSVSNDAGSPQNSWSSCPSADIVQDTWNHVVARWSFSNGRMSLTVNGVKKEQALASAYFPSVKGVLDIGHHSGTNRPSNSHFRDLIIFNREIHDEEVDSIYRTHARLDKDKLIVKNNLIER